MVLWLLLYKARCSREEKGDGAVPCFEVWISA